MLAEQRHQYIFAQLDQHGAIAVADIVRALSVSRETVRRDLNALAERGFVTTTHGGALSVNRREPHVDVREHANAAAKQKIGTQARLDIVDWIEGYYNRQRLHTFIDFLTPVDYQARLIAA